VLRGKDGVRAILTSFVRSAALVGLASYVVGVLGSGVTYDLRLSGIFESANYLSLYIAPAIMAALYFFFHRPHKITAKDIVNTSALAILMHALFLTQSYAAIIAVFGSLGLYVIHLILINKKIRKKAIAALALLAVIFVVIIATQINAPKFRQFIDFENRSSSTVRLEIYQVTWALIKENAIFGIGPGLFQAEYQTHAPDVLGRAPMEWNIPHPHNIFAAFWLNSGILGLLALLTLLILAHKRFTYPLVSLWALFIHGLFDTPFWKNDLSMIFWLLIACILILQVYEVNPPKKRKSKAK